MLKVKTSILECNALETSRLEFVFKALKPKHVFKASKPLDVFKTLMPNMMLKTSRPLDACTNLEDHSEMLKHEDQNANFET